MTATVPDQTGGTRNSLV